jgi:Flp pilus assembly pilin Flp
MSGSRLRARGGAFVRDESGGTAVEFSLVGTLFILLLLAVMDFGIAFWQWNQATKAVQLGVRLASVSNPVSSDLKTLDGTTLGAEPGDPMPYFKRVCSGATASCTGGTYDQTAMNTIVFGRGNTACPTTPQAFPPMCMLFPRVRPQNVIVEYVQTGLGFAGRPGGPVPTIRLRLTGLTFEFVVLNDLLGLPRIAMDGLSATATAEDMSGF